MSFDFDSCVCAHSAIPSGEQRERGTKILHTQQFNEFLEPSLWTGFKSAGTSVGEISMPLVPNAPILWRLLNFLFLFVLNS